MLRNKIKFGLSMEKTLKKKIVTTTKRIKLIETIERPTPVMSLKIRYKYLTYNLTMECTYHILWYII